jgi:hypothetical protein
MVDEILRLVGEILILQATLPSPEKWRTYLSLPSNEGQLQLGLLHDGNLWDLNRGTIRSWVILWMEGILHQWIGVLSHY